MKFKLNCTPFGLRCFRIISAVISGILIILEISSINKIQFFSKLSTPIDIQCSLTHIINFIAIGLLLIVILFPQKFFILAIISFSYALLIIPFDPNNHFGFILYYLGISILILRGILKNNRNLKLLILNLIPILLTFYNFRFGIIRYFYNLLISLLFITLFNISLFFIHSYYKMNLFRYNNSLNLANYKELNERDGRFLQGILANKRYKEIAANECISEGTLKNRIHYIFKILQVSNKQDFIQKYNNFHFYYNSSEINI